MDNNTIGVISVINERSQRDLQLQKNFSCTRTSNPSNLMVRNGTGVLGTGVEERSVRDKQMIGNFSCSSRENYSKTKMIYPRSEKDTYMLSKFNCNENFKQVSNLERENYCGCQGTCNCSQRHGCGCGGIPHATLNFNPYNSSSNITFVPLQ